MSSTRTISATRLMELLTPTLGWDKSSEIVSVELARRGLSHGDLAIDDALALLEKLAQTPGLVAHAARYATTRVHALRPAEMESTGPQSGRMERAEPVTGSGHDGSRPSYPGGPFMLRPEAAEAPSSRARPVFVELREIVELFASGLPPQKAQEAVTAAARRLGITDITGDRLDKQRALALVDHLAEEPGMVGLSARFAKARLILRFAA